ncbi:MAG: HDIG domain-containing protein [Anaerolineae bacterium]|nr:MAG: HDIG domain-containing protein [Anaerolineae bacterium]
MSSNSDVKSDPQRRMQHLLQRSVLWIFALVLTLGITFILSFNLVTSPQVSVELGEPAPQAVIAPRSVTFVSEILTNQARQQAAAAISDIYTAIDLSIARTQLNQVHAVFNFIDTVRADQSAEIETKLSNLESIEGIAIDEQIAADLLQLSQDEFIASRDNVVQIVEEIMREGVVDEQLSEARRKASQGIAFDLTPAQERIVASLAPQFVVANIFLDETATAERKAEAMDAVAPISQIITKDETFIRVGDIIDAEDIENLEELGLLQVETDFRSLVSAFLISILAVTIIVLYWLQMVENQRNLARNLTIIGSLILLFVLGGRLLIVGRSIYSYLYPAAAFTILIAVLFETRLAIVLTTVLAGLIGYIAQDSLEMTMYAAVGGFLAVLTLRDTQKINALFRAGLFAAIANIAIILIFRLPQDIDTTEMMTLILFGLLNGPISASLSLAGIFIIGVVFGITTPLHLQELSRMDHPLLQELLRRAPGTYHHSIMVANLAEQAAERIKANSTLVRVGAFYHDVGKLNRPIFFSENQNGGNPHDNLDPFSSARIIMSHVPDGLELAKRYKLPNRIRDFIAEHHGNRVLKVFYDKACEQAAEGDDVDISRFRYSGPRPRSRESGLVQLADSIEATSSALRPDNEEKIEKLVNKLIDEHLQEGQMDNSGLTLGDIQILRESFTDTLQGRFHVRIRYPGNEELTEETAQEPEVPAIELESAEGDVAEEDSGLLDSSPPQVDAVEEIDAAVQN